MTEQVDFEKNKKNIVWIWVAVGAAVLCLCLVVVAAAVGAVLYLKPASVTTSRPSETPDPVGPTTPPSTLPSRPAATPPSELTIEPLDPNNVPLGVYGIYDLILGYQNLTEPGENDWQTTIAFDQPVAFFSGWCTVDQTTLEQNFEHILYLLEVDGRDVPTSDLYWEDSPGNGGTCRNFYGVVTAWPVGQHRLVLTMRFDQDINDGWGDYSAGDYVDRFEITVTP